MLSDDLRKLEPKEQAKLVNEVISQAKDTAFYELVKLCLSEMETDAQNCLSRGWHPDTSDGMLRTHAATLSAVRFMQLRLLEEAPVQEEEGFNYTEEPPNE